MHRDLEALYILDMISVGYYYSMLDPTLPFHSQGSSLGLSC